MYISRQRSAVRLPTVQLHPTGLARLGGRPRSRRWPTSGGEKKRDGKRADTVEKFSLKIAAFMPFNGLLWRIVSHLDDNITRAADDTQIKTNIHAPSYMLQLFYFSEIAILLF